MERAYAFVYALQIPLLALLALMKRVDVVRQDASALSVAGSFEHDISFMELCFGVQPGLFVDVLDI